MGKFITDLVTFLASEPGFVAVVNLASIVGLAITVWVFADVRNIKRSYVFRARVPQHVQSLKSRRKQLTEYMNDFVGMQPQIDEQMAGMEVELESLVKKLKGPIRARVRQLLEQVRDYSRSDPKNVGHLRTINLELYKTVEAIGELQEDLKWRT